MSRSRKTSSGGTVHVGLTQMRCSPDARANRARQVRLVEQAERSRAPMARLADRFAIVFLVVTVGIAAGAWILTGDPIRAVAVLVVATPCPLILAVPVALVGE